MNLRNAIALYHAADMMGPGAIAQSARPEAVISKDMARRKGKTQIAGDASPSDLASHHVYLEPSSTDTTIRRWRDKRQLEKKKGRNLELTEADAEMAMFGVDQ